MDNPQPISPLIAKLTELKRLHIAERGAEPKYVVCNQFTAQQVAREAQSTNKMVGKEATITIEDLLLVVHPQDHRQQLVMEVV